MKTDLEKLNAYLIALGNADRIGIRKKIVLLKRYITYLTKSHESCTTPKSKQGKKRAL